MPKSGFIPVFNIQEKRKVNFKNVLVFVSAIHL